MRLALHFRIAGAGLVLLALAHVFFPKRFRWKEELGRLSLLNRQIFLVHTFFISLLLLFFGGVSFFLAEELLRPAPLARGVLLGFTAFWALRLLVQLFIYDPALWRGDRFNTIAHLTLTAFWCYLVVVYGCGLWGQLRG